MSARVRNVFDLLLREYGPQNWWPARTKFEVVVGAILTQATSWSNVEKAIKNLRDDGVLDSMSLHNISTRRLARLIKPALYYNTKARKLKSFTNFFFSEYNGSLRRMSNQPTAELRRQLLDVWGVGPETADSILLYALDKPSFVVDSYTKRVFSRLGLVNEDASYDGIKKLFEENLPQDVRLYKELHALIVEHTKRVCRKNKPLCKECCVSRYCR